MILRYTKVICFWNFSSMFGLTYLGWEFITPSLFLEAEKADVRFGMVQHLGVYDLHDLLLW